MSDSPFQAIIDDIKKRREQAVEAACIMIEADAKLNCPVKTGALKRSITHETTNEDAKTTGKVGTNVEYAYWAEKKQPYLEPAVDSNLGDIKTKMAEIMTPKN